MLLKVGSDESLAGRFELNVLNQWSYQEMRECFSFSFEKFIAFGGYPGAVALVKDEERWKNYIQQSLVEAVISKDILALKRVEKPALLRQFFLTVCSYPSQVLSLNRLIGQLADAGNVTTLKHYADLCSHAFLLTTLPKYSGSSAKKRASSPKWILRDNSYVTALSPRVPSRWKEHAEYGLLVENAVGSHLLSLANDVSYCVKETLRSILR